VLLLPFSWAYGLGVALRNGLYDLGFQKSHGVGIPVISVGNITVGGTGKTPLSLFLLEWLSARGLRPAYLSRGYGRSTQGYREVIAHGDATDFGDEPLLVKARFPSLPVAVCEDRVAGARRLIADHQPDVLVLDDAFQHRRIHRDLDIVVADAGRLPQHDWLLPAGRLRERLRGLRRAHFVVISKVPDGGSLPESPLPAAQTAWARLAPESLAPLGGGGERPLSDLLQAPVLAFCGIGNPEPFRRSLLSLGADLRAFRPFADHHPFTEGDLREILGIFARFSQEPAALIVTTEKDAHRLGDSPQAGLLAQVPVVALRVGWEWIEGGDRLAALLEQLIKKKK
jgi:tetraacyldisaccharide 4'-kinase